MTPLTVEKTSNLDKEAIEAQFQRDGYVLVPGAISRERVLEIRKGIAERINNQSSGVFNQPAELLQKVYSQEPAKGILTDLFVNYPEALDVACNDKVTEMLKVVLGDNFVMLPDSTAHWGYYNIMHADTTTAEQQGWMYHKESDYRIVVVGMYLQDNQGDGGGLYLVPGTHNEPDPFVKLRRELPGKQAKLAKSPLKRLLRTLSLGRLYNYEKPFLEIPTGFDVPTKAGDVLIFDMRLLHRSSFPLEKGLQPEGGKMSIFVHASRNNQHATNYVDYIKTKFEAYAHLHNEDRNTTEQTRRCEEYGFTAL